MVFVPGRRNERPKGALECGDWSPLAQTSKLPQNGSLLPLFGETPARLQTYDGHPGGEPPVCGGIGPVQAATSRRTPGRGARSLSGVSYDAFTYKEQAGSCLNEQYRDQDTA